MPLEPALRPEKTLTPHNKYSMRQRVVDRHAKVKANSLARGMESMRLVGKENLFRADKDEDEMQ